MVRHDGRGLVVFAVAYFQWWTRNICYHICSIYQCIFNIGVANLLKRGTKKENVKIHWSDRSCESSTSIICPFIWWITCHQLTSSMCIYFFFKFEKHSINDRCQIMVFSSWCNIECTLSVKKNKTVPRRRQV